MFVLSVDLICTNDTARRRYTEKKKTLVLLLVYTQKSIGVGVLKSTNKIDYNMFRCRNRTTHRLTKYRVKEALYSAAATAARATIYDTAEKLFLSLRYCFHQYIYSIGPRCSVFLSYRNFISFLVVTSVCDLFQIFSVSVSF